MWELNRTERRALITAAGLIGLAAFGRVSAGTDPGELRWLAAPPQEVAGSGGEGLAGDVETLKSEVAAAMRREERARKPLGAEERIDPNTAPEEDLRRLPGIGPGLAAAIIDERLRGEFRRPGDLQRVPGIGPATYARMAPHLTTPVVDPVQQPRAGVAQRTGPICDRTAGQVDVNTAAEVELQLLPGIGPVLARRVVQVREARGPFAVPDSLIRVPGIGPRLLDRLRDRICLSPD
jgi:competence protein ComEA